MNKKTMSYLIYPAVVSLAVGIYAFSSGHGGSLLINAFGAVVFGAMLIAVFEQIVPYQLKWRPRPQDVKDDLLYTILIQIAVPRLLGFVIVLLLADQVGPDEFIRRPVPGKSRLFGLCCRNLRQSAKARQKQ